ncbi:IclR family transcriptional regulator domain-containing protein [Salana multivorans]
MLSVSDPVWIDRTIKTGLRPLTHRTITDPTELRSELTRTRVRGFAIDDRERDQLTRAVAAPVFGFSGEVVGAVELSAPVTSLPSVVLRSAGEAVVAAGRALSEAMGSKIRSTRTREV